MTSKEALEILFSNYIYDGGTYQEVIEEINKIEQDLEILEILKNHYKEDSLMISNGYFISIYMPKEDKDFEKIKEWLENDK